MAAAFELGGEVLVHNLTGCLFGDEASGHDQHVGIVVLTDEMGNLGNPSQTGTDRLMLVERHADALAGAADGNAGIDRAVLDGLAQGMTEVAVVTAGLAGRAEVTIDDTPLHEILLDEFFQRVASVVAGHPYYFNIHSYFLIKPQITRITRMLFHYCHLF